MTTDEFKAALKYLGWSQAELGRRVKVSNNTVTRWVKSGVVPGAAVAFINLKVEAKRLGE